MIDPMRETDLYEPLKSYFVAQGYEVKSEITDCDLVAVRRDEPPVIVELKLRLSLALVIQGTDRQAMTDAVYIAVLASKSPRWRGQLRDGVRLCRRLGLGLITVRFGVKEDAFVEVHADPAPYRPRKSPPRKALLLREFARRVGDPNTGGQTRRAVVTAYRQDTLRVGARLAALGASQGAVLARDLGIANASAILQKDYYGWFIRVSRGLYDLSPKGREALVLYADVLKMLGAADT